MPEALSEVFGQKLEIESWANLNDFQSSSEMVETFQIMLHDLVTSTFPEKTVKFYAEDKPWFTEKLRQLKRERQRLYKKGRNNQKYLDCKKKFDELQLVEIAKYRNKIIAEVKDGKRGSAYSGLRKLGSKPGEFEKTGFQLPIFTDQNLSNLECAEIIANYFSCVSQEYSPLDIQNLPPNIQEHLGNPDSAPVLSKHEVYRKLTKAKKPNSVVPGDLPRIYQ